MRSSTRLIVNTGAQYIRTIINLVLSLYSTRLILHALGIDDYGIFTLIAGVVSMLSFMTSAMISTTQRFMSYHQTKSTLSVQQQIFSNSVLLHILFALIMLVILEIIGLFLFDGFLNIVPDRIQAARIVYQAAIVMILLSFVTAPFKALLISHENLVYVSVVDVLDGILKVGVAFSLLAIDSDKLIIYGFLMVGIYFFNLVAFLIYDYRKYAECILPKLRYLDKAYIKSMSSFVGWQLYSTGCIIGRTQGTAIVLNRFFGTAINAAFGIALQISGAVNFVSTSLLTAINPQIVKAEGAGERHKMFILAEVASKFSFLLLAMLVVPIIFILPSILQFWLGEVPEGSVLFCRVILITALVDQITLGLGTANQAIGNIGPYALTVNTLKVLTVPCIWILLSFDVKLEIAIWSYALFELICAITRLPFLKLSGGLNISEYSRNVFFKIIIPLLFIIIIYSAIRTIFTDLLAYILICIPTTLVYFLLIYCFALNQREKDILKGIFAKFSRPKR